MEAKGSQWQGDCCKAISEGGWRQKRGSTYRYAPYRKVEGRQMRRGESGTSPQHRTKSSIHHGNFRISDDRALKVAEVHPNVIRSFF